MAQKRAGAIVINISAGTAELVTELNQAKAHVRDFGTAVRGMGAELERNGVSEMKATSAAMKVLKGDFLHNARGADAFAESILGLGPLLQKAFPAVGALAFAGVLADMAKDASEFYKALQDGPEKLAGGFASLNAGLRTSNDALELANARLDQDIAKLEGKRQNTLAIALLEAKKAADDLADSLDRDLSALSKVLDENKATVWQELFGRISDAGLREQIGGATGFGGFRADVRQDTESGRAAIESAASIDAKNGNTKAVDAAIADLKQKLKKRYQDLLDDLDAQIKTQQKKAGAAPDFGSGEGSAAAMTGAALASKAAGEYAKELQYVRENFARESRGVDDQVENYRKTQQKTALGEGAAAERPFQDRMKQLDTEIEAAKAKLAAIGQGEPAQAITNGFTAAWKAIEEVNKALEKNGGALNLDQMAAIHSKEQTKAQIDAEAAWKTKLEGTTVAIDERIASLGMLSAAIGKGYEATKRATVETSVMGEVGLKNYMDPARQDDVAGVRAKANVLDDKERDDQVKKSLKSLQDQIDLERALAKVQADGAEAIRRATLAQRLKQIADTNSAEAAKKLMAAEIDKYNADRALSSAETVTKLDEETAATERLTAAVWGGADAIRAAAADNKYHQTARDSSGQVADAEKKRDEAKYQEQIATSAARMVTSYGDALKTNERITQELEKQLAAGGDALQIGIALRNLENERLKLMAQQTLEGGRAEDGVKAFFLDMQQSGQTAAKTIYDAMHSALDESSNELANLLTGRKTNWGKMFQDIGHQMLQQSIKSGFSQLLGMAAGKNGKPSILSGNGGLLGTGQVPKLGSAGGLLGLPDGTSTNPYYVVLADGSIAPATANQGWPQIAPPASQGPGVWSILGAAAMSTFGNIYTGALGNAGGSVDGDTPDVHSTISFPGLEARASGGDVSPSSAYLVGEHGPEILFGASGRIASNSESRRMLNSGAPGATYMIDARGTDPVQTEMRVKSSLAAVHGSAVVNSVQTVHDMDRRMPARR